MNRPAQRRLALLTGLLAGLVFAEFVAIPVLVRLQPFEESLTEEYQGFVDLVQQRRDLTTVQKLGVIKDTLPTVDQRRARLHRMTGLGIVAQVPDLWVAYPLCAGAGFVVAYLLVGSGPKPSPQPLVLCPKAPRPI